MEAQLSMEGTYVRLPLSVNSLVKQCGAFDLKSPTEACTYIHIYVLHLHGFLHTHTRHYECKVEL